jgi:hypothetical protein
MKKLWTNKQDEKLRAFCDENNILFVLAKGQKEYVILKDDVDQIIFKSNKKVKLF